MKSFRILLAGLTTTVAIYTVLVFVRDGANLLPVFFGQISELSWGGQFNLDFLCYLILSGLWVAWRHRFDAAGLTFGALAAVGGILVLAPYLLVVLHRNGGDMRALLMGPARRA